MPLKNRLISLILLTVLLFTLAACGDKPDPEANEKANTYVFSMDTVMTLTAYGSNRINALNAAEDEINRLNDLFSIGVPSSEVATANREGSSSLTSDTLTVLNSALEINKLTGGCFDITVTPLMELWGFTTGNHIVPSQIDLDKRLALTGTDKVIVDSKNKTLTLLDGTQIDLGGIAKGYTSQRVMEVLKDNGVSSAIVSLGGNVQCLGLKPDGSKWRVGIREPWGLETSYVMVVELENCALITSGGYERYFEDANTGKIYCHILDPKTGYPVESDLDSVSIVSADGTLADGLSTALYIMGFENACEFWRNNKNLFDVIFIDKEGNMFATEGIYSSVSLTVEGKELTLIN